MGNTLWHSDHVASMNPLEAPLQALVHHQATSARQPWRHTPARCLALVAVSVGLTSCGFFQGIKQRELAMAAKVACSGTFVANRPLEEVQAQDVLPIDKAVPVGFLKALRDAQVLKTTDGQGVQVTVGHMQATARFRGDLGCALDHGPASLEPLPGKCVPEVQPLPTNRPWPEGEPAAGKLEASTASSALQKAVQQHLDDTAENGARAVVVVKGGRIVAEGYAKGFNERSKLLGWSMAKSVTSMLLGTALKTSDVNRDIQQWLPSSGVPGRMGPISVRDLLEMRSGMSWNEGYEWPFADVNNMLFDASDFAAYTASQASEYPPGKFFKYASGTSNVLQAVLRQEVTQRTGQYADYCRYPYTALFQPIGAHSARMEADGHGTYAGSSYMYATARDWARLGLLLLNDGRWPVTGAQVIPSEWVKQSKPGAYHPGFAYGWQLWGLMDETPQMRIGSEAGIPADAFHMAGHWGQSVSVIPSRDMVIVRLGWSTQSGSYHAADFLRSVLVVP